MPSIIGSLTRAATRKPGEPLNILTFPTHESYESNICRTDHNFYAYRDETVKDWNKVYRPLPSNYTLFNQAKRHFQIPVDLEFDLILSQNKFGQYQLARQFADAYHLPLISLEHTLPHPSWPSHQLESLKAMRGDLNIFISEFSREAWGWDETNADVIHHGIDTNIFQPNPLLNRKQQLLSVVNDWVNRDWCCGFKYWQKATEGLPVFVKGATPGLSEPARTLQELVWCYQSSRIFVNTSTVSPVPTALLEAMACGCCVVSAATCMIPSIIEDGVNGFLCDTPENMQKLLRSLLDEPDICEKVGQAARRTVEERFGLEAFVSNWNQTFTKAAALVKFGKAGG
jgi:glycosyltransferase involved in cell wall biosynthesis